MLQEINSDELFDLNGGSIFTDIGYAIGRLFGEITKAVGEAKWHPYGPCGGDCCTVK